MKSLLIVGNGIAGLTAADSMRAHGFHGEITVIGAEQHQPYSRPALSKSTMNQENSITAHLLPVPEHGAKEILGVSAVGLNINLQEVSLSSGESLPFEGLLIATGVRPRKIREDLGLEFTFRNLEDAINLRERLIEKPDVIVIGAGVLGMELASTCQQAGCRVRVIPRQKPMLGSLGTYLGDFFTKAAKLNGVEFLEVSVVDIRESAGKKFVLLNGGAELQTDLIITAIGDSPNVEWLKDSGLLTNEELRVDTRGRVISSQGVMENIVAAGDVASVPVGDTYKRIPLWTSAVEQAKVAALTLLSGGEAPELDFQPYFWTEQFGYSLRACGNLPLVGDPQYIEGNPYEEPSLMRWQNADNTGTAVSINFRIPIPKLRALSRQAPSEEND